MSSKWQALAREIDWIVAAIAVLFGYLYLVGTAGGLVVLAVGWLTDGVAPTRDEVVETLGAMILGGAYLLIFSPFMLVVLIPYRIGVHAFGHPRRLAVSAAIVLGILAFAQSLLAPAMDIGRSIFWFLLLVGYAAVVPVPGSGLGTLRPTVRWAISGIVLSWFVFFGSLLAAVWATAKATRGQFREAGALLFASTAGLGLLAIADLFREDAPSVNYLVSFGLMVGAVAGLTLLVVGSRPRVEVAAA